MDQVLLLLVVALTVAAVVFGVTVLVTGRDPGLAPAEPDGRAVPLPAARPLREADVSEVRFDTAPRGYRMAQVDQAMRRAAYDIGYKSELIGVLEAEVAALREGRTADAEELRRAREQAAAAAAEAPSEARGAVPVDAGRPAARGETDVVVEPIPAFAGATAGSAAGESASPGVGAAGRPGDATARPDDEGADRAATDADGAAEPTGATKATNAAGAAGAANAPGTAGDSSAGGGTASPAGGGERSGPAARSEST
ncbi:DivIVA domain-containing protein [Micromonospora sp. CPCC 205561]|uniref:DivIVA domain-containing protein n=1 Tax=Micromonospora sp. CPCC 205561 TaxID=3122407 RepID=UPI003FA5748A